MIIPPILGLPLARSGIIFPFPRSKTLALLAPYKQLSHEFVAKNVACFLRAGASTTIEEGKNGKEEHMQFKV